MTRRLPDERWGAAMTYAPAAWVRDAVCAQTDPELFFPDKGQPGDEAKAICRSCPVLAQCRLYALNSPIALDGIWGGMSAKERRDRRRETGVGNRRETVDLYACGTEAGARRHYRAGEPACPACSRAATAARVRRRA